MLGEHVGLLSFLLAEPHSMWDLSSPTRFKLASPALEAQSFNHWTTREVPGPFFLYDFYRSSGTIL